jgi:tetratricopeptide (TPR) repeat protein
MSIFGEEQTKVRHLIRIEKYDDAIELCKEKIQYLEENEIESDNNFWFFNLRLAICYRRKGQYKKAINYVNKSSLHAMEQNETMECWWTLASCYYSMGNINSATKFYKKCKEYYERVNDQNGYDNMDFNIAKINKDIEKIKEIINRLNRTERNGYLVDNAYALLCELYISNNQVQSARSLIHNIQSDSIKRDIEKIIVNYKMSSYVCCN